MVRGIFCHDLPIYKDINGVYCSTTLTNSLFQRYFHVVDELIVATRVYPIDTTYEEMHQEKIDLPGLRFLDIPNVNTLHAVFHEIPMVRDWLTREMKDVDIIIIRGGMMALLGVDAAKRLGKPYLTESGGCAWDSYWNHSLTGKLIAPYMEYRAKKDCRDAAFVIYVTEKWLQNRYPTNGISTHASNVYISNLTDDILEKRLAQIETKDPSEPIVIGTTAAVNVRYKGQQYVIQAMGRLKDKLNLRYELVGGGDQSYLRSVAEKAGVADRVIFKGQMTHAEVLDWLDGIDVYAQPSRQEGLPRALIEAMSRGCPAMGSTTAGIPELLEEDVIFHNGDVAAIARILQSMTKEYRVAKAKRNFAKAKEYDIHLLDARRERIYEQYRDFVLERKK